MSVPLAEPPAGEETASTVAVAMPVDEIVHALEHDYEFFIQFFHGDFILNGTRQGTLPRVPDLHIEVFSEMVEMEQDLFAAALPRGFAKTTIAKLACVYYALFRPESFFIYLSCTHTIAAAATLDIVNYLTAENFRSVFGTIEFSVRRESDGEYKFRIPWNLKTVNLVAQGANQQIRGMNKLHERPQVAFVDDLESVDPKSGNILTQHQFDALRWWFYGSFMKALAIGGRVVQIGNLLQKMSLLYEHLHSPLWRSRLYGCIRSNGEPLWEEHMSIADICQDYKKYEAMGLSDLWMAEMMNAPSEGRNKIIRADQIHYLPVRQPGECAYGFVSLDLASSDQSWAHNTALACTGWVEEAQCWQVVDHVAWRGIDPIELFRQVAEYMHKWGFWVCGIESIAFQAVLAPIYTFFAQMTENEHLQFVPVYTAQRSKPQRLMALAAMLKHDEEHPEPTYALTTGDVVAKQQLLDFNPLSKNNDDDTIDAIGHGVVLIDQNLQLIMEQKGPALPAGSNYRSIYQLSPV